MSIEIEKQRYYDSRLVQTRPKYAINQGALSISSAPFVSLTASSSQLSFQLQCPASVFLDRRLPISAGVFVQLTAQPGAAAAIGDPVIVWGRDFSSAAHPLHSLFSTIQCSLGDAQISVNSSQTRDVLLRLLDSKKGRRYKTSAAALETFASNNDAAGTLSNPLASFSDALFDAEPNGCTSDLVFINPVTGEALQGAGNYTYGGVVYTFANGAPTVIAAPPAGGYPIFLRLASTELLQLSPFLWEFDTEDKTGLFGLTNISLTINLQNPATARMLRFCSVYGRTVAQAPSFWTPPGSNSPFANARVVATFLTPPLSVPLAPRSIVPWSEAVAYQLPITVGAGPGQRIQSQTLSLACVPDIIVFAIQPIQYGQYDATWFLAPTSLSLAYNNYSGLLSSLTQQQLFQMTAETGVTQTWSQWRGSARTQAGIVQTAGGFLALQTGRHIPLSEGEAAGVVENITLQAQLTVDNPAAVATPCMLTILCLNSGFLACEKSQVRVVRGPITQSDVLSAPVMGTHEDLRRMIGSGVSDRLASALSKGKDMASGVARTVSEQLPKAMKAATSAARQMGNELAHRISLANEFIM